MGKIHLIHGLSTVKKMEGGIHMGAVMGAHGKNGQIVKVSFLRGVHSLLFRRRISGINAAGKDFLADVINFHSRSLLQRIFGTKTFFFHFNL
jgi:hypothetical protein